MWADVVTVAVLELYSEHSKILPSPDADKQSPLQAVDEWDALCGKKGRSIE